MTSDESWSNKLREIGEIERPDHFYLEDIHACAYFGEYTARKGWAHSQTNSIINNLKKHPNKRDTPEWEHKIIEINRLGAAIRANLKSEVLQNITIVPAPPSKLPDHPDYDDRMFRVGQAVGQGVDVRQIINARHSREPAHLLVDRPGPDVLRDNFEIDETVVELGDIGTPILLLDDVLVTGATFVACSELLKTRFQDAGVFGLFIARRVPERNFDIDEFDIWDG